MGVSFLNSDLFGTKVALTKLFEKDPTLSSIPLRMYAPYYEVYTERFPGISLEDSINVIKHSIIYQVIGATPEFIG
jgi:hypothetical protein